MNNDQRFALPGRRRTRTVTRMGIFSRKPDLSDEASEAVGFLSRLERLWQQSPGHVIHHFIANAEDPLTTLAHALVMLAADQTLTPHDLKTLGIDQQELERLVGHITGPAPAAALRYEVDVVKALAEYETQIDEILSEAGVNYNAVERNDFRATLARFAAENSLTNLKIAYRLMKAEGEDPLKPPTQPKPPAGYI